MPADIRATVVTDEPCPAIPPGPGKVVLTTINHLNSDVYELTLTDASGRSETIRPTGLHKFYSQTRQEWISTKSLKLGEELGGLTRPVRVASLNRVFGTYRVYNMTVEGEHVYHVSNSGALAHNNGCAPGEAPGSAARDQLDSIAKKQLGIRTGKVKDKIIDDITKSEHGLKNQLRGRYDPSDWE